MKKIILIDADIELFRISQQHELEVDWGDCVTMSSDSDSAKTVFKERIQGLLDKTGADDYILCISGSENFRKKYHPTYKSNRVSRKPIGYNKLKEYAMENFTYKLYEDLEADDVMGILASLPVKNKEYFIYSDDKDMWTIPALIWCEESGKIVKNTKERADLWLYTQILTGDVVDGYKGCPKVGKVKAEKALADCETEEQLRDAALREFVKAYKDDEAGKQAMLDQAQQARILRHTDWDMKKKSVILWNPWGE